MRVNKISHLFVMPAILLVSLYLNGFAVGAQSELERAINGLQSKYNKMTTLSADFAQVHTSSDIHDDRRETGHLLLKKPGRMKWDYTSPEPKQFISDGTWLYEYVPSEKSVTRSSMKDAGDMRAPFAFLLGQGNLKNEFRIIDFSKETPIRAGNKVLRLIPKHLQDFDQLLIEFDPVSYEMSRMSIVEPDGDRSDFLFSNIRENVQAPSIEFVFHAPPGVEVRDN